MDTHKVVYTKKARRNLDDIAVYLETQSVSQERARRFVDAIKAEIDHRLSFMPQGYRLVANDLLAALGLRILIVKRYLVFFTVDDEKNIASVKQIIHGRRDWATILTGDGEEN